MGIEQVEVPDLAGKTESEAKSLISSANLKWKSTEKIWQKILYFSGLVVMTIGLFVGGSYAPETYLFLCGIMAIVSRFF